MSSLPVFVVFNRENEPVGLGETEIDAWFSATSCYVSPLTGYFKLQKEGYYCVEKEILY